MYLTETYPHQAPLRILVVTWVLLLPLLFLAVHGQVWFLGPNTNFFVPMGGAALVGQRSGTKSVADLTVKIAIMATFYVLAAARARSIKVLLKQNSLLMAIMFWIVTSALWSQSPITTLEFALLLISNIILATFLSVKFDADQQMRLFALVGTVAAVSTVAIAFFLPSQGIDYKEGGLTAWEGIFNHKNDCAIVLSYILTCLFFSKPLKRNPPVRIICIGLLLLVIVMSESRTGWILVATFLIYIAIVRTICRFDARGKQFFYPLAAAGISVLLITLALNASNFFLAIGKSANATGRTGIWLMAMKSVLKHPILGYGYHAFFMGMQGESANTAFTGRTGAPMLHAQSGFLDVWLELGLIGLLLISLSIVHAVKNGVFCLISTNSVAAQWYLSIIFLTEIANIGERNLMCCNFIDWVMYLVAYIGLNREAATARYRRRTVNNAGQYGLRS